MILLKIGGSVITRKSGYRQMNEKNIDKIASSIARAWKKSKGKLILVNGAGSFGHAVVLKHGINDGIKNTKHLIGFAEVHEACSSLSFALSRSLISKGVPAVVIPPLLIFEQKGKRLVKSNISPVKKALSLGCLPILHGTMVFDSALGASVMSGDKMMAALSPLASVIAFGTDVDGVLDSRSCVIPLITRRNLSSLKSLGTRKGDVTGGMLGKVTELFKMRGKTVYIFNLNKVSNLDALLSKGSLQKCTKIKS